MSGSEIEERVDRLEEIAETLENGNIELATADQLREEADEHLSWLRERLEDDSGRLIEVTGGQEDGS
jgi:exonuclease VII small subunit